MQIDDYVEFFEEFVKESDRAAIVLGAAHMDELLKDILKKRLINPKKDLFEFNGPFGTFSARINSAYVLGVIDKAFTDKLHMIRNLRNSSAHNIKKIDLNTPEISQQLAQIVKAFDGTDFWSDGLKEMENRYHLTGNSLVLKFAIALLVVNLAMLKMTVEQIDSKDALPIRCPQFLNK